ncbi:hypothetical protein V6N12_058396 [Hibiscus sabdariffa]|uniref:GRPD C-terminal domain-containing protein n=1 Tax=Hibiscus sabdariffa TaxID=183260 RepID=A0ABR2ETZ6_9ROSI
MNNEAELPNSIWETVQEKEVEETKKVWERTFDEPFEKAGGGVAVEFDKGKTPIFWEISDVDVNSKYKSMIPRFLLEVHIFVRLNARMKATNRDTEHDFLSPNGSNLLNSMLFCWNDFLKAPSITLRREVNQVRVVASITPPVQAPYLLKCVPDRVTNNSETMISDVIMKLSNYRPQKGRWLSRTVLDHAGRECFVVRIRVGEGFWRRGAETPSTLKLLRGRKMEYQGNENENKVVKYEKEVDDGFITLVRFTEGNLTGRAIALLNWKLLVVELAPEEDAVLVLLLFISILRTPWYWNASDVMAHHDDVGSTRKPAPVKGSDMLYKRGIITYEMLEREWIVISFSLILSEVEKDADNLNIT